MGELTVASVMTTRVVTVEPETPLRELVATMTEADVRAVPVVDRHGLPIGVVSRSDLVPQQRVPRPRDGGWRHSRGSRAAELMTTPVRAVHAHEPVSFAAGLLAKARIRRLFVINWDSRLVGVVARRDLLRAYVRGDDELRAQLVDLLHTAGIMPGAVDIRVDGGVVTVAGAVARHGLADMIVRTIRALPGVVDVRDNLRYLVAGGTPAAESVIARRIFAARPETTWSRPREGARA